MHCKKCKMYNKLAPSTGSVEADLLYSLGGLRKRFLPAARGFAFTCMAANHLYFMMLCAAG